LCHQALEQTAEIMSDHSTNCAANGCPGIGSMSASTAGWDHGAQFYCFLHFGCKPGRQHAITNELQRLAWLVRITQQVRGAGADWDKVEEGCNKEIRINQSSYLLRGDHESLPKWLARLEDCLRIACAETDQQPAA
jgi:hypothetical protein